MKAAIFYRFNPLKSCGDMARWARALEQLDLVVAIDIYMSETALLAHYVLPESHYLERADLVSPVGKVVSVRQQVIPPLGDTRSGFDIVRGLAEATGVGQYFGYTVAELNNKLLEPVGWTHKQLCDKGVLAGPAVPPDYDQLNTPSGKVELASERVAEARASRTPRWLPPMTEPAGDRLRLLHGRSAVHTHGYTQNNPQLHALMPENELWIHPDPAAARGIADGDLVEVANEFGREQLRARVTPGIRTDCVWMCHGFGTRSPYQRLAHGKGANDNALYPILMTPVAGALGQGDATVTITRVGQARDPAAAGSCKGGV